MFKFLAFTFTLTSFQAFASNVCIAEKDHDVSYGSTMKYKVICEKKEFYSKKIITGILLPIPYRWEKKAREVLTNQMKQTGHSFEGEIVLPKPFGNFFDKFLVYDKTSGAADYCLAFQHSFKKSGINRNVETFDVQITCTDKFETSFSAVTEKELKDYLGKNGFRKEFSKKIPARQGNVDYTPVWIEMISVFKK